MSATGLLLVVDAVATITTTIINSAAAAKRLQIIMQQAEAEGREITQADVDEVIDLALGKADDVVTRLRELQQ